MSIFVQSTDADFDSPYKWGMGGEPPVTVEIRDGGGYAYRPNQVIVRGPLAEELVQAIAGPRVEVRRLGDEVQSRTDVVEFPIFTAPLLNTWAVIDGVEDVVGVVNTVRAAGLVAQPNYVYFADTCGGCPCPPHPSLANDLETLVGNPLKANPLKANPLKANPLKANPLKANSAGGGKPPVSSARPSPPPTAKRRNLPVSNPMPRVVTLDTGLAHGAQRPDLIKAANVGYAEADDPDTVPTGGDQFLDPAAGHGTFIAGIIEQECPGTVQVLRKVVQPLGDADEFEIIVALLVQILDDVFNNNIGLWPSTIVNISISGYRRDAEGLLPELLGLVHAIGIVVVASAGNLSDCRPAYPAALPTVIAVGALGPDGPADFTNYGSWVDACAPGTDLESAFFRQFNGRNVSINGVDRDSFHGWATWSGTSFAAPMVVSALVAEMRIRSITAKEAVELVIDGPNRTRLPNLGTVVAG